MRTNIPESLVEDLVVEDDRNIIHPGDPVVLIVEDDVTFARILVDMAHEQGLKALVALRGVTALSLAREFKPGAITLDITLPDMVGWTILDRLKHDPLTRHIPVHIISGDENRRRGLALGAMTYIQKTVGKELLEKAFGNIQQSMLKRVKKLLLVTPGEGRDEIRTVIGGSDLEVLVVSTGGEALAMLGEQYLDGIVIDTKLSDIPAIQLVEEVHAHIAPQAPPIILLGRQPDTEEGSVGTLSQATVVRYAPSFERLLDETVLLLHRDEAVLSEAQRQVLQEVRRSDAALAGRKVLVIDDDLRNIFALTSLLEHHDIEVLHAENGRAGIELLKRTSDVDVILMDIMMPEMDGYETTRAIRKIPQFQNLPIIALTAKAMKGDRDKCLEAGATDYVTKPVDLDQLFSVMRVWISRRYENVRDRAKGGLPLPVSTAFLNNYAASHEEENGRKAGNGLRLEESRAELPRDFTDNVDTEESKG
jgi:CheY-like chemotaxis protein